MAAMTRRLSLSEGARPSLSKMFATCFSTTLGEMTRAEAMAALDLPWAMSDSTSRSRGVSAASVSVRRPAWGSCLTTSGSGPALGDAGERVDEVADVGHPVLEQVTCPGRGAGEQFGGRPRLDVLGEHQHADLGEVLVDLLGGAQPLIGVRGRHPHVDDRHVRPVLLDRTAQRVGVGYRGEHVVAAAGEGLGEPVAHDRGVLGYDDTHQACPGSSIVMVVGPPG